MAQGSNSPIATKEGVIEAINNAIASLPRGLIYKGAVDYYSNLPASPEVGDCYTVRYKGDSGTTPSGKEYAWGPIDNVNQWIDLGPDLSGFVERQTTTSNSYRVYAFNDGGDAAIAVVNGTSTGTVETTADAIPKSTNGRIRVATPVGPYHAANKKYVDDIIDARNDSSLIPTSANTTGKMKFVILSSIPETRYDGYMYIITEA